MSKIVIGKAEIGISDIIKGAAIGAGVGFIAVGIKSIYDARKMKCECGTPEEEVMEFEEYLAKKEQRKRLKKKLKISCGIYSIVTGATLAATGIIAFTPLKKVVVTKVKDGSIGCAKKIKDYQIEKIKDRIALPKLSESTIVYKIKDNDIFDKIKENEIIDRIRNKEILDMIKNNDLVDKIKDRDIIIKIKESDLVDKILDTDIIRKIKDNAA